MTGNTNTVVLKTTAELQRKLQQFYREQICEKTPDYAVFQAKAEGCTVTLYQSGKLMFQGKRAKEESSLWSGAGSAAEESGNPASGDCVKAVSRSRNNCFRDDTSIGSDEVGTGDFLGPVVVTASFVPREEFPFLYELGVRDSKKLTDEKIMSIAPRVKERITHVTRVLSNLDYNDMRGQNLNMNQIKAILHNDCLAGCLEECLRSESVEKAWKKAPLIVLDQFEPPAAYYRHIKDERRRVGGITFMTKAEDQCLAVAVSSIISRFVFIKKMRELGQELGCQDGLPFGAGSAVDAFARNLVSIHGEEVLPKIAKMNFANVGKVLQGYE